MNKRGLSITELLVAVIIMAIAFSLVGLLISSFQNANHRIEDEARANTEASTLIAFIERDIDEFSPTDYRACETGDCVILENHFEETYLPGQTAIVSEIHDPPLEYTISYDAAGLTLGGEIYSADKLTISSAAITFDEDANGNVDVRIAFTLSSDSGNDYDYSTTHTFKVQSPPAA